MSGVTDSDALNPAVAPKAHRHRRLLEWIVIVVVALAVSWLVRGYAFQTFYIPSGSMLPTLQPGDRIVVNKISVELGSVHTGDIVVFKAPALVATKCGANDSDLIKRVIGVPGDLLSTRGNTIFVNGRALVENWPHSEPLGPAITPLRIPANSYFVMGDNHSNSCDSRYWGLLPRQNVLGKAFIRIWPIGRLHWF
jgi:signal peptidase I